MARRTTYPEVTVKEDKIFVIQSSNVLELNTNQAERLIELLRHELMHLECRQLLSLKKEVKNEN